MEKGRCVRVFKGEEVIRGDPVEYFLPTGSDISLESQRGDGD